MANVSAVCDLNENLKRKALNSKDTETVESKIFYSKRISESEEYITPPQHFSFQESKFDLLKENHTPKLFFEEVTEEKPSFLAKAIQLKHVSLDKLKILIDEKIVSYIRSKYETYLNLTQEQRDFSKTGYTYVNSWSYNSKLPLNRLWDWEVPNMSRTSVSAYRKQQKNDYVENTDIEEDMHISSNHTSALSEFTIPSTPLRNVRRNDGIRASPFTRSQCRGSFCEAGTMCEVHGQTKHRHNHYSHHTHKSSTTGTVIAYSGVGLEPPINDCVQLSSSNGESKSIRDIQPSIIVKRRSILHRRTFFENAAEISEKLPQIGKKLPFFILLLSLLPFICWYCGGFAKDILSNVSTSFSSPMQLKSATPVVPSIHLPQDHLTSNAIQELQSNQIKLIEQVSQLTEEVQKLRQKNHRNHDPHDDIDLRSKLEDTNFKIANCCLNETELASIISAKIMSLLVDTNASSSEANIIRSLLKNIVQYEVEKTAASSQIYTDEKLDSIYKIVSEKIESLKTETYSSLNDISSAFENRPTAIDNNLTVSNIKDLIREALTIYDADKTGEPDYALESAGGTVIDIRCSETFDPYGIHYKIFGIPVWSTSNSPRAVIQPTVTPGDCWAFRGSQGYLVVKLSRMIVPTSFTYEHIPKQISREGNINSAPREFQVRGLKDESDTQGEILGNYYYEDNGQPLQNFPVKHPNPKQYQFIEFVIISNHGHEEYTCLYRFRVHGKRIHF